MIEFPIVDDFSAMSAQQLRQHLDALRQQLAQLDDREPRDENDAAYEQWVDEHEQLEDDIDEILDLLDELDA